eukprot:2395496-Pleurochrysis_carterae.AAC.1
MPLQEALELLGMSWASLAGEQPEPPQEAAMGRARAGELDEVWLLGGPHQAAVWRRLASLHALGVHCGDDRALTVGYAENFIGGLADVAADSGHVALSLHAAAAEAAQAVEGALVVAEDIAQRVMVAADRECAAALAGALDALGHEGKAEVAAGA